MTITNQNVPFALVLSGGVGLGAYHAGVYEAVRATREPDWIAGSSIGAVTAAIIVGAVPDIRMENLRRFWHADFGQRAAGPVTHFAKWGRAIGARLVGVPGQFRPRFRFLAEPFSSIYDLSPMRERIEAMIDFDRLNGGSVRLSIATTDIETGEQTVFDTGKGDRIEIDHLLASCGFLPEFAPMKIGGRLLGDGGLSGNAPVEAVLDDPSSDITCIVVDLYARDGIAPTTLEGAFARRNDLLFANQTWQRLLAYERQDKLRQPSEAQLRRRNIVYLSYRASIHEAGPEKMFDYSSRSISERWQAGREDAAYALTQMGEARGGGTTILPIRRPEAFRP